MAQTTFITLASMMEIRLLMPVGGEKFVVVIVCQSRFWMTNLVLWVMPLSRVNNKNVLLALHRDSGKVRNCAPEFNVLIKILFAQSEAYWANHGNTLGAKTVFLLNCRYCADRAQNLPDFTRIWLTMFQISYKSVHFRRSYCRTREDRQRVFTI